MKINLPEKVNQIITTLLEHGHEAYAVGGCVRDSLLGREADDWDITTSADPYEVKALFRRTIDTGIQHGTVTVMLDKDGFEVTTYRVDGEYEDGRHPKEVQFTKSLTEDLRRRDFTINAMAYNEQTGLVDIFGGVSDLKAGIIRCVGEPKERFEEDALRILRAYRFSAQLGFSLDDATRQAATALRKNLEKISAERIRTELTKLLLSENPDRLMLAWKDGITAQVLPEWDAMMETPQQNENHQFDVGTHTLHVLEYIANGEKQRKRIADCFGTTNAECVVEHRCYAKKEKTILRFAALLHDVAKPSVRIYDGEDRFPGHAKAGALKAREVMRRLKFDNETTDMVVRLVAAHNVFSYEKTPAGMRHLMHELGPDLMDLLWELQLSDVLAQHPDKLKAKLEVLKLAKQLHREVLRRGDCVSLKELAVNGRDLISLGGVQGKELGVLLSELLCEVLEHPEHNTKEYLLQKIKRKMETSLE